MRAGHEQFFCYCLRSFSYCLIWKKDLVHSLMEERGVVFKSLACLAGRNAKCFEKGGGKMGWVLESDFVSDFGNIQIGNFKEFFGLV